MSNYYYHRQCVASLSLGDHAFSPQIIGFSYLFDLLRWYKDPKRSTSSMSKEFLPKGVKEIYYQANPIIIFRRDKINIKKLERIFVEFQEIRDHINEKSPNSTDDDPLSKIPDFENPLGYLDDFIEKHKTERFIQENANLRYFVICNIAIVQVKIDEPETNINKSNGLNDIINSAVDISAIGIKWGEEDSENIDINGISDKNSKNYLSNDIDSGWERLDDSSHYNSDIEMDEQSQEFWDSL